MKPSSLKFKPIATSHPDIFVKVGIGAKDYNAWMDANADYIESLRGLNAAHQTDDDSPNLAVRRQFLRELEPVTRKYLLVLFQTKLCDSEGELFDMEDEDLSDWSLEQMDEVLAAFNGAAGGDEGKN